jgi:septal ring factor EnvC (AmiA/AmiB activator)
MTGHAAGMRGGGRARHRRRAGAICLLLLGRRAGAIGLLLLAAAAPKDDAARRLRATEHAHDATLAAQAASAQAAALAASRAQALAARRVQAAAMLRTIETRVQDAAQLVRDASAAQKAAEDGVAERTRTLSALLPLALRLSRYPAETLLAAPAPPDKAIEGLLAAHGVAAELERQVAALRTQQDQARALAESVTRRKAVLAAERGRQDEAASALDQQIRAAGQAQTAALDQEAASAQAASALAAKADDLRSAIAAMDEAERQAARKAAQQAAGQAAREAALAASHHHRRVAGGGHAEPAAPGRPAGPGLAVSAPKATLVAGRILRLFGAAADDGPATGMTFSVAPRAFVASPCTGRVAFAAPFRSYGKLMIIECGGGYDFVLSGMASLDIAIGRTVRPGEPVGRMPDFDAARTAARPVLYVELRKNGQPVNPLPYLNGKA